MRINKLLFPILFLALQGAPTYAQNVAGMLKKNNSAPQRWANPNQNPQKSSLETKPMYGFIENKGQIVDQGKRKNATVKYILPLPGNNVALRPGGFSYDTYVIREDDTDNKSKTKKGSLKGKYELLDKIEYRYHRVDIDFVNANPKVDMIASEPSEDFIRYYTSETDENGIVVNHFGKVTYKNIYPNIDVEFIARPGKEKPVEYNFIVHPGGDASLIKMRYRGPKSISISQNSIELTLAHGKLVERIPMSYKKQSGEKIRIDYKQIGKNEKSELTVGFTGEFGKSNETVIIDPTPELLWEVIAPYGEITTDIDTDASGKLYLGGMTDITTNFVTSGVYQSVYGGGFNDAYLMRRGIMGNKEWCTYFGGSGRDEIWSIVIDDEKIFVTGITGSSGLATAGAYQSAPVSYSTNNYFVARFTTAGVRDWFTYSSVTPTAPPPGTSATTYFTSGDITSDLDGNIYVLVSSYHNVSPTPADFINNYSTYVLKFKNSGAFQWQVDRTAAKGEDIVADQSGNTYITGEAGPNFVTYNGFQDIFGGLQSDAFLAKYDTDGNVVWASCFGGQGNETGQGITLDIAQNVYIAGWTISDSLGTAGTHRATYPNPMSLTVDAFVAKFTNNGSRLWATYYGSTGWDAAADITVDSAQNVYINGRTNSLSNSTIATPDAYQTSLQGGYDQFAAKFTSVGLLEWGTYYGTNLNEQARDCKLDIFNDLYILGWKEGSPTVSHVAKFSAQPPCVADLIPTEIEVVQFACASLFSVPQPSGFKVLSYEWDLDDGQTSFLKNPIVSYGSPATYDISAYIVYRKNGCIGDTTLTYAYEFDPLDIIFEDTTIEIQTKLKSQVLSSTASTFSDAWVLQHEAEGLSQKSSFVNGSEGVWRNEGTYVFDAQRSAAGTVNVETDGTYSLYAFDWRSAEFGMVPSWIKANTMTEYSPFSYELENKDVLGVYSAALYDYGGHLPSANGVNMRNKEMAFTSFEYTSGKTTGNFIFGVQSVSTSGKFEVLTGYDHVAVVKAPMNKIQGIEFVNVMAFTFAEVLPLRKLGRQVLTNNRVICVQEHPSNSAWSIVVLQDSPGEVWKGSIYVEGSFLPPDIAVFDTLVAHSGKYSLKIQSTSKTFPQQILELDSAKSYYVSAWVSVNNLQPATPSLADSLGIKVRVKRPNGALVSENFLSASGPIIEGWQQIKGVFNCSINDAVIELKFLPGSGGTAWYDDVRLHPENGNMKSYVYDLNDYRLQAILDEENFASFFYYDAEGNLYLTKKETVLGVKTLTENISYQKH